MAPKFRSPVPSLLPFPAIFLPLSPTFVFLPGCDVGRLAPVDRPFASLCFLMLVCHFMFFSLLCVCVCVLAGRGPWLVPQFFLHPSHHSPLCLHFALPGLIYRQTHSSCLISSYSCVSPASSPTYSAPIFCLVSSSSASLPACCVLSGSNLSRYAVKFGFPVFPCSAT